MIVGAVLRKDLKESLNKLNKLAQVANAAPVSMVVYMLVTKQFNNIKQCSQCTCFSAIKVMY